MGYYTHFKIVLGNVEQENKEQIIESLEKHCTGLVSLLKYEFRNGCEYDGIVTKHGEYIYGKWYNFEEEMSELSKHYPNLNITIQGSGEEVEDNWIMYIKAGKTEHHRAEFPTSTLW